MGQGVFRKSVYLPPKFVVHLKLLSKSLLKKHYFVKYIPSTNILWVLLFYRLHSNAGYTEMN